MLSITFDRATTDLGKSLRSDTPPWRWHHAVPMLHQLALAVQHLHAFGVVHRDLKPQNILLTMADGGSGVEEPPPPRLRICDFGMAREIGSPRALTSHVVTRWYRAPELRYGCRDYGPGVDMWAVGCVLGELLNHAPLFVG